jgi:hypothetical protein
MCSVENYERLGRHVLRRLAEWNLPPSVLRSRERIEPPRCIMAIILYHGYNLT